MPLPLERLMPEEAIDRPLALVFVVFPSRDSRLFRCPWTRRQRFPNVGQELHRAPVKTDLESFRIEGPRVDVEHALPVPAVFSVLAGWDAPLLLEMRRHSVSVRTRRTSS
jgi:hypothetical protein